MKIDVKNPLASKRFLVIGAGAVGTYVGASLVKHGHEAVFVEKPTARARIVAEGMHLNVGGEIFSIPNPVVVDTVADALKNRTFDFGIFALKSFDTQAALNDLKPFQSFLPPILCLQNGVENEPAISKALGEGMVISGSVASVVGRGENHETILERLRGVGVAKGHPRAEELVQILNSAGLKAEIFASAPAMKWSKLLTNLLVNASSAILRIVPDEILANPGLFRLEITQLREALQVMGAMGIPVVDLPGTPVRMLAMASRLPAKLSQPILRKSVGGGRGGKMPSFFIDLVSGRGITEVDYLNGAVVRYGERLGITASTNKLLTKILQGLVRGDIPVDIYASNPDKLLDIWRKNQTRG